MEGNFLSRYNNKMDGWKELIRNDPANKNKYEAEMAEYVMKCMPFMNEYTKEDVEKTNTDNIFNVKETTGLKRKDIFTCLLYTSPSPRDRQKSRMPSSA